MKPNQVKVSEIRTGVQHAIRVAGGQVALAKRLGVSQQAVSEWLRRGWVPLLRAREIEIIYGIPREKLVDPRFAGYFDPPAADLVKDDSDGEA